MTYLDSVIRRNRDFADRDFRPDLRMMPSGKALIVGCVDPRVDPATLFKLDPGEAAVLRNIGGRVTPALLETLAILREVTLGAGADVGSESSLVLLQHTDCGIRHAHRRAPELLAQHMGIPLAELESRSIDDPYEAVALDVAALRASDRVPGGYTVSGLVYDVATGRLDVVVPPTRLRPPAVAQDRRA
jgi:carbonic anhydrase